MKTSKALISSLMVAALATCGFAQGKGGGASHSSAAPGAANRPADFPPAARTAPPSETPARPVPHPDKPDTPGKSDRAAAPAAQDYTARLHQINETAFNDRKQLLDNVDMGMKSSRDALKQIQSTAKASRADARSDFKAALSDVKAREKEVDSALKDVRKANENGWNSSRDALAKAYQAHADAMARLEAAAKAP